MKATVTRRARRLAGVLLLALTLTPVYRVLNRPETGSFGEGTIIRGDTNLSTAWWGLLVSLGLGAVLAFLLPTHRVREGLRRAGESLGRIPLPAYASCLGVLSTLLAALVGLRLFLGLPTLVDGMASLLHARYLAAGALAGTLPGPPAGWMIANTVLTPAGWVSQYPPLHPLLLAVGLRVGAHWAVGPLLVGVTTAVTILVAGHLLPERTGTVRLGGILVALSPFLLFLGGGYLSHVPAAAFTALTLYFALRARDGGAGWSVLAGAASGALVATRPWIGLVLGVGFTTALWFEAALRRDAPRLPWLLHRLGGAIAGGLPFAVGLGLYDAYFFGHPLRLGYAVAYGPAHSLGFHPDPWGNVYGPLEALGYSAANLLTLGVYLLETPFPVLPLVALLLLRRTPLPRGAGVLLTWALLPTAANFFYWHHGFHLGPRMLYEAAPAWLLLAALAAVSLTAQEPRDAPSGDLPPPTGRLRPPDILLWALLVSLLGPAYLVPLRAEAYSWTEETLARIRPPRPPEPGPALVFVHGSWAERIAGRLQGAGMRLDSVESALRRNDVCRLEEYTRARLIPASERPEGALPELDFRLLANAPPHLRPLVIVEGEHVPRDPSAPFTEACRRQARSDRFGVVSLAPLLWQGDLPGAERGAPMFVRDLGPELNREILAAYPDRTPYVYFPPRSGAPPELHPYEEGMRILWEEEAGGGPP